MYIIFRKIRFIDKKFLWEEIFDIDLCKNLFLYNFDGLVNVYNNIFKLVFDYYVLVIIKIVVKRLIVFWFNVEVKFVKKEKRCVERKWCRIRLYSDLLDFKVKKNLVICVIKKVRFDYYMDFIMENCSDLCKFFKFVKLLFD